MKPKTLSSEHEHVRKVLTAAIRLEGEVEIDVPIIDNKTESLVTVGPAASQRLDQVRKSRNMVTLWRNAPHQEIPYGDHETKDADCRAQLHALGLTIPDDYVLHSRGRMMVVSCKMEQDEVKKDAPYCEGEVLVYVRVYRGHKLYNERYTVAMRRDGISFVAARCHALEAGPRINVREVRVDMQDPALNRAHVEKELIFVLRGGRFAPAWKVTCGRWGFLYDAVTGDEIE